VTLSRSSTWGTSWAASSLGNNGRRSKRGPACPPLFALIWWSACTTAKSASKTSINFAYGWKRSLWCRGGMVQGLRFVQAVRRRPAIRKHSCWRGRRPRGRSSNRAQPLNYQSCRAFDRPRHGLSPLDPSPLDPSRPGLSASLNLTACRRTYSSTQRKVEKATDSEPSQAGIS
jgi:hypothetical protein